MLPVSFPGFEVRSSGQVGIGEIVLAKYVSGHASLLVFHYNTQHVVFMVRKWFVRI